MDGAVADGVEDAVVDALAEGPAADPSLAVTSARFALDSVDAGRSAGGSAHAKRQQAAKPMARKRPPTAARRRMAGV